MVIAIVGIFLLNRLHEVRWANQRRLVSTESGGYRLPQERLPVRKIKEVLRLQALGLSQRQIALSCAVGQATVSDYLKAAETAGFEMDGRRRLGRRPIVEGRGSLSGGAPKPDTSTRTGLRRDSPGVANP